MLHTGRYDPLHIMPPHNKAGLPANTLLDGHRRARLLQDLGIDTAEVIVRHDLVNAERAVVDMAFYDFALGRRNSQPLDLARMVMDRYEIEKNRPRQRFGWRDYEETRDHIGKVLRMSGHNFGRYYNVLLGPREVQDAFRDKRLKLVWPPSCGFDAQAARGDRRSDSRWRKSEGRGRGLLHGQQRPAQAGYAWLHGPG